MHRGKFLVFWGVVLVCIIYGWATNATRDYSSSYHRAVKQLTCYKTGESCTITENYNNPQGHPNHCWNFFDYAGTDHFPNPDNASFPKRLGKRDNVLSPFSTATNLVYLTVAFVCISDPPSFSTGVIATFLCWLAVGSFNLHRTGNENGRFIDHVSVGPLLAVLGTSPYFIPAGMVGVSAGLLVLAFEEEVAAFYTGAALLGVGLAYKLWTNGNENAPRIFLSIVSFVVALSAKSVGDHDSIMRSGTDWHHRAECRNDLNAAGIEDASHGTWHVFAALGIFLYLEMSVLERTSARLYWQRSW